MPRPLRILFLVSAHNGLSQRMLIALTERDHDVTVAVVDSGEAIARAVEAHGPDLVACPFLKTFIPGPVWSRHRCLIVHPGPVGDRGPSSLDWAIETGAKTWGVTVLEATDDVDGGPVWATRTFAPRPVSKSGLYRHEVRRAAVEALVEAVGRVAAGEATPEPPRAGDARVIGRERPLMTQHVRAIDWQRDATATVVRKIRAGDGHPGVLDAVDDLPFHLFGAHGERTLRGTAGELVGQRDGAICRATVDGAVWITHLKPPATGAGAPFKLPAMRALDVAGRHLDVPEIPVAIDTPLEEGETFREISYTERAGVGYLRFDFYNGAMSTDQCRRLLAVYAHAAARNTTKVIVLEGGDDFFSTGIHLNVIEAADDPGKESWRNLTAIDDLARAIIETRSHLVVSALGGDAGAGGVPLALAADHVVAREDVVLNPYYSHMGGLYGSEYWTYVLPRLVGNDITARLVGPPFDPIGTRYAVDIGLIDSAFGGTLAGFRERVRELVERLARDPSLDRRLKHKHRERERDERAKPLSTYRTEELQRSQQSFFGEDSDYHEARHNFVLKLGPATPVRTAPTRFPSAR